MSDSEAEDHPSPYIATEILELILDELGAEAESLPTASAAFQTLLNCALTGRRALTRCQRNLFTILNFDSPEGKGRKTPAWMHLRKTIAMFEEKPHFASYVRRLRICFFRAFYPGRPPPEGTQGLSPYQLQNLQEVERTMLPQLLQNLPNIPRFPSMGSDHPLGTTPGTLSPISLDNPW